MHTSTDTSNEHMLVRILLWHTVWLLCTSASSGKRESAHPFLEWVTDDYGEWMLQRINKKVHDVHEVSFLQTGARILARAPEAVSDHAICTCRLESGAGGTAVDDLVGATSFRQHNGNDLVRLIILPSMFYCR